MEQPERFNPHVADARWQKIWEEQASFVADDASEKPRAYVLEMFPYPSGRIHIGHVRNYTMGDVLARYKRMTGHEVLHPMGWDAFGMPAENAAMEKGVHPGGWTRDNIANMRTQLKRIGLAIDWTRELATCEPEYYGHEQALFLKLYAAGLVYRKESAVNWDPVDMTVLANEQVIDGKGWRSGAPVERRKLSQWFLKITDFADELLEGLGSLDQWPDKVRLMQENWIGRSQGLKCRFKFPGSAQGMASMCSPRAPTRCSAQALSRLPPIIRSRRNSPPTRLIAGVYRGMPQGRDHRRRYRDCGEKRVQHRPDRRASARPELAPARLCRQLRADGLWHRRGLRLPRA